MSEYWMMISVSGPNKSIEQLLYIHAYVYADLLYMLKCYI